MLGKLTFKRANLARAYCDSLAGKGIADARSGLFLAGPRRVGKSTFLLEDLLPEAKARKWLSVYVDLWSNRKMDPAILIIEAVKKELVARKNTFQKLIGRIRKINLKVIELDFSQPGLPANVTLSDLLSCLIALSKKPLLLVIDEAQHALSTDAGINTMFSLKSARDQINSAHEAPDLMLVFTGSNRDKLAQLVVKKDQPFFGSEITAFPLLGRDFTDFLTSTVNKALAANNQFTPASMWDAFQKTGHRPEILRQIVGSVAISNNAGSFSDLLKQNATLWQSKLWEEYEHEYQVLSPLQQIILMLLIQHEKAWSPFSESSMQQYQEILKQPALSVSTVQTAIQSLRDRGFIWQSSRGAYALEDLGFAQWLQHHTETA